MKPPVRWKLVIIAFAAIAAVLLMAHGNRFVLTNDEGLLLDSAQKVAGGARMYVDFYAYLSPGSFWLQAAVFRLLGISLMAGRVPVILDFSMQCALLFWLAWRLSSRRAGITATLIFAGFQLADPSFLTAQHRWDSSTLAFAGMCVAIHFADRGSRAGLAASGALMAAAAWCTPTVALAGAAQTVWLAWPARRRKFVAPFLGGAAVVSLAAVGQLVSQGAWGTFVGQMLWLHRNYGDANVMPYGSVIGGYRHLLEDAAPAELPLRALLILCLALPAILPPFAAALWGWLLRSGALREENRDAAQLALLSMAMLVASTYPRSDLMHLAFVAAIPYALTAAGIARVFPAKAGAAVASMALPFAALFVLTPVLSWMQTRTIASPVGKIRVAPDLAPAIEQLLAHVRPGDGLFVYPYLPIEYFLTQARNPSFYSYLGPAMIPAEDEGRALADLQATPPAWILFLTLPEEEVLRIFPGAKGKPSHVDRIEGWILSNYRDDSPAVNVKGYRLLHRVSEDASLTAQME